MTPLQIESSDETFGIGPQRELNGMILGQFLGGGCYRKVYACPLNPNFVIKVEVFTTGRFCNVDEWNLWNAVRHHPEIAAWFAPIHFISGCGTFLVQERTKPLARMPKQVPHFVSDVKLENMGRLRGRPVFHDYANTKLETLALRRLKLVDAS